jgi:hypothetical protein
LLARGDNAKTRQPLPRLNVNQQVERDRCLIFGVLHEEFGAIGQPFNKRFVGEKGSFDDLRLRGGVGEST